ncbi:MAG TPA: hypothetical protein VH353_00440 [Caulobacteraceae bacterium]|nr:hypothetical protein [Caulobacteraceae bacterium]
MKTATVHLGLHKTGSTYIQSTAHKNFHALLEKNLYFRREVGYPAHHPQAWAILERDLSGLDRMIEEAEIAGASDLLISSEDLESLVFKPDLAIEVAHRLLDADYDQVVFAMFLRNPGETFWSIYSEISKHLYIDPMSMLTDALRLGYVYVERPHSRTTKSPYWHFCFDHGTYIPRFRDALRRDRRGNQLGARVYRYDDADTFLGRRFFADLGVLDAIKVLPSAAARNGRLTRDAVQANYVERALRQLTPTVAGSLEAGLQERTRFSTNERVAMADAIENRFGPGLSRALFAA